VSREEFCHWPIDWKRPAKFAMVGAMGVVVQLAMLHEVEKAGAGYLVATAIAVETAVLHNFLWHQTFTWADRERSGIGSRLLRFHLSNGFISMTGNILFMAAFVSGLGMKLVIANLLSITLCCLANFLASDRWVFVTSTAVDDKLSQ